MPSGVVGGPQAARSPAPCLARRGYAGGRGDPASLPACIQPGTTPSEQPDPASPPDQHVAPDWPPHQPPRPRPLQAPAAARPVSAQTPCIVWMSSCPSPLDGQNLSPYPERPQQQTLSLPESGGRGLRSGCGGPHPGLRGRVPCLRRPALLRPLLCPMLPPLSGAWGEGPICPRKASSQLKQ